MITKEKIKKQCKKLPILLPILPLILTAKKTKSPKYPKQILTVGDAFKATRLDRILTQYIAFKIKPKQDAVVGDIINGAADIYFDFNPPIITNTVSTEIVAPLSVDKFNTNQVSIYPNPAKTNITIKSVTITIDEVSIYDLNGRLLKAETPANSLEYQLSVENLSNGIYF